MSQSDINPVDIKALRRLLGESDRDIAALSREEADRIIAIPDLDRRLRAYMGLREVWAYGGDRLLPEDDDRIQASFSGAGAAAALAPPPAAPPAALPLTPVSLLGWAERWRTALVASALERGASMGGPRDAGELEALATLPPGTAGVYLPELVLLRQLDTLITELREGLEARQLLPGEALPGDTQNLGGLLKVISAARARREIAVPPAPPLPARRCTVEQLICWLESLLIFEESLGARALIQAGAVVEPGEARARFLAAARGDLPDIEGHAAAQIGSWRRANAVYRAVDTALRGGWLTRARSIVLPSFEVPELEAFFLAFAAGIAPLLPAEGVVLPGQVARWWEHRRAAALRSMALTLLAEGVLVGTEQLDQRAEEMAVRGLVQALPELALIAEADKVLAACRAVLALDVSVGALQDGTDSATVLRAWGHYVGRPSPFTRAPAAPAISPSPPARDVAPALASTSSPQPVAPGGREVLVDPAQRVQVTPMGAAPAERAARPPRPSAGLAMLGHIRGRAWPVFLGAGAVLLFQAANLLLAAGHGDHAYRAELAVRLARLGDPLWLAQGSLMIIALVLAGLELGAGPRGFLSAPWTTARWSRCGLAGLLLAGAYAMPVPPRYIASAEGFAAWPERVVARGGVPVSTLVPAEGLWLRGVAVEPMSADDLPAVAAGAPPLILLREVGPFGRHLRWLLANRTDVEAQVPGIAEHAPVAPSAILRKENAQ